MNPKMKDAPMLAPAPGTWLELRASGHEADVALAALIGLIENKFDEDG